VAQSQRNNHTQGMEWTTRIIVHVLRYKTLLVTKQLWKQQSIYTKATDHLIILSLSMIWGIYVLIGEPQILHQLIMKQIIQEINASLMHTIIFLYTIGNGN
jgi:hypothetical protein